MNFTTAFAASALLSSVAFAQTTTAPADTGQADTASSTTSGAGTVTPATAADVKKGATVSDQAGEQVGTVESVDADGAVISTGKARAKVPLSGIGKTETGLVTTATRAQIEGAGKSK